MKPLTGAIYQVEGIQCTRINTGYIHVVCFSPNSTELLVPRLHMHVIGQINNNLIIINLSSMGLLSFLDNGLSYKNFQQQSQHNSYKKNVCQVTRSVGPFIDKRVAPAVLFFFFFALFSASVTPRVTKDLNKRQKDLFKETKLYNYMKPEKLD